MRIVNRKEFLKLPAGTLYSKYEPCAFDPLEIKGNSMSNDFMSQDITGAIKHGGSGEFSDILFDAQETGADIKMDFGYEGRDGMFDDDDDQLFAVWSKDDVRMLIDRLEKTLK